MSFWGSILNEERHLRAALDAESQVSTVNLFEKFEPNPGGQAKFIELSHFRDVEPWDHRWTGLIGGIGSGKSYCGAAWAVSRALLAPDARGLITANNFGQLSRASLITLAEVCEQYNIPLEPHRGSVEDTALAIANCQRCYIGPDRAFVYVLSLNSFKGRSQAARGLQVRWSWIDEAAYADEKAFLTLDGRLGRGPGTLKGQGILTTSPNGYNWLYGRLGDPNRSAERKRLYQLISCSTRENVKYLGEDYVAGLLSNYTDELAAQELEGAFINTVEGRVYKYFDRKLHCLEGDDAELLAYNPDQDLHIAFDFNASPAVCVLSQLRGKEVHVFREFFLLDSDVWELSSTVCTWIAENKHNAEIYLYGDASGAARSAASRMSCWDIVFDNFREIGYSTTNPLGYRLHKRFGASNPAVINRINSVNCLFKQHRIFLSFNHCPELIKDFEMLTWAGDNIDKGDLLRSHLSDALGYLLHRVYPYKQAADLAAHRQRQKKPVGLAA